ncbi:cell envelope biogenesis protein OmpA [Aureimonas sp. Leaf454]|uniref:OmpA family protein n=1 Tax=Aureimonas sp. Leaf454 TaxID=1736381 RepID=UPI0006F9E397|nr:OmpA family protein [Aureimonas sp. Leaf454]KQT52049.1 cell envelope biogenesis protein OmpA [Aureimonas sp. Leaf454]
MKRLVLSLALSALAVTGCTTNPYTGESQISNTLGGAGIGAGVGALGGYVVGKATGANSGTAALIGAGIGGLAGGGIGAYMDNQEAELRRQLQGTGVSVTRVGDRIVLNMPSNITFPSDGDTIRSQFYPVLNSVAIVLAKYDRSAVDVAGHTDSQGSDSYNYDLSQRRAESVADYLASQRIDGGRLNVRGYGESQPVADNATDYGRAENRRVEVSISPYS